MRKKSFAATITIIFCAIFVSVIGATFSTYLLRKNIIKIENPKIESASGIFIYDKEDKIINELKLSDMKLGLKPATGEEDVESEIPSTVTSKVGSEGYFATFKVTTPQAFKIFITDIVLDAKSDKNKLQNERENIKVSLEDVKGSTKNLVEDKVLLYYSESAVSKKEFTIYVWLTAKASDALKGAKISFTIKFE